MSSEGESESPETQPSAGTYGMPLGAKVLLGVIVLLFGIFLLASRINSANFLRQGVTVKGVVTSRFIRGCGEDCNQYYIAYTWEVDGRHFSSEDDVYAELYENLSPGNPIALVYLPNNPGIARPEELYTSWHSVSVGWVGGILILVAIGYIIISTLQRLPSKLNR